MHAERSFERYRIVDPTGVNPDVVCDTAHIAAQHIQQMGITNAIIQKEIVVQSIVSVLPGYDYLPSPPSTPINVISQSVTHIRVSPK